MKVGLLQFGYERVDSLFSWPDERQSGWAINYGDVLVSESLFNFFRIESPIFSSFGNDFSEQPDLVILRGSTYLHDGFDFDAAIRTIDSVDCPILTVGIGVQSADQDASFLDGNQSAREFARKLSERSASVSVRGHFTADVLQRLGVKNLRVTGCPSLFYMKRIPRVAPPDGIPKRNLRIGLTIHSELVNDHFCHNAGRTLGLHGEILDFLATNQLAFSVFEQGNINEIIVSDRGVPYLDRRARGEVLLRKFGSKIATVDDFVSRFVRLTNTANWLSKISDHDVLIGFRFHGVVAGILQNMPAFMYLYDSRLTEFSELYCLPSRNVGEPFSDPVDLVLEYDWSKFNAAIEGCHDEFSCFFRENGVSHLMNYFV